MAHNVTLDGAIQLEAGQVASAREIRPGAIELILCQRYYEQTYSNGVASGTVTNLGTRSGIAASTTLVFGGYSFLVGKRVAPTVTLLSAGGTSGKWSAIGGADTAAASATFVGTNGFGEVTSSALTKGDGYFGHWIAVAEL